MFDYFEDEIPFSGPGSHTISLDNDQIAALGRILFYDNRLSLNNSISCAHCHQQKNGFSDNVRFSRGLENYETSRNSMTLVNNAFQRRHFWEGHSGLMEDHILDPISNHIEMGMRSTEDLVYKLSVTDDYIRLFEEVYDEEVSEDLVHESLSTFVASLISYNSKFDKGQEVDFANFTATELAGKDLFFGKAKCGQCHKGDHYTSTWRSTANIGLDLNYKDEGAGDGKFKIPTLRNIELTSPYMHDGRFETLDQVVNHYTSSIQDHPQLDWELRNGIQLSEIEKEQLIDFLLTLTDYEFIAEKKFSNPFR